MDNRTIVAIEIASSKIKGAASIVEPDGTIRILAVETIPVSGSVRHGRVQNIREVSAAVNDIIRRLERRQGVAPRKVQCVMIGFGGRSLNGIPASAHISFAREIEITEETIRRLKKEAAKDFVGNKNIEDCLPKAFYVNNLQVKKPVGTVGSNLRGDFLLLTCGKETRQNIERLKFDSITAGNVYYQLRQTALADLVLSDDDRQVGCALVDLGAETCTISIYKDGSMAFMATLPMGSRLITMDLMTGLKLSEAAAEDFKLRLGSLEDNSSDQTARDVNNYVRARAGEIAANIVNQIELSGFSPEDLGAGIILTGGGALLPHFDELLAQQSHMEVSKARFPAVVTFEDNFNHSADMDVVALIKAATAYPEFEGLSSPQPAQPEHVEQKIEPEEPKEEKYIFPEDEPEPEPEPVRIHSRRIYDDDDPHLLDDEPDDIEPRTVKDDFYQDDYIDDDEEVDDEELEKDKGRNTGAGGNKTPKSTPKVMGKILSSIRETMGIIFSSPTDADDDAYQDGEDREDR